MSSLRPAPTTKRCLAAAAAAAMGPSSVRIGGTSPATVYLRAIVAIASQQQQQQQSRGIFSQTQTRRRHQPSSSEGQARTRSQDEDETASAGARGPKKPDMSFRQFAGRALGVSLRNLAVALSPRGIRQSYRESPGLTSMNIVLLLFTLVFSAVAVRSYMATFYNAEFSKYPEPVANTLRKALYYTNVKPDPELALKYYKRAMEQCAEAGLDPFTDEVLGIRIQVSYWLQKIGSYGAAIHVLETVLADCRRWIAVMEQSVKDGQVDARGRFMGGGGGDGPAADSSQTKSEDVGDDVDVYMKSVSTGSRKKTVDEQGETLWAKRQRLLAKAISISVKLGELDVAKPDEAHAHLVWAVETALSELARRKQSGSRPGESTFLKPEELGGAIESLGRDYERRSQFQLAIPLFFQALRLCETPCHRATIMNNLAASFGQNDPSPAGQVTTASTTKTTPSTSSSSSTTSSSSSSTSSSSSSSSLSAASLGKILNVDMPATRKDCLEAGLNWAQNAYTHARDVQGEERTAECDEACAVALCNWADVAAMLGRVELARSKYEECIRLSTRLEFADGEVHAREGLANLASAAASSEPRTG